jgi:hypothetical protein
MYIENHFNSLLYNIIEDDYKGNNPYDLLASNFIHKSFKNRKIVLLLTQLNKISPINFRPLLGINKRLNPKASALIMSALIRKDHNYYKNEIEYLKESLIKGKSNKFDEYSIGFSFPISLSFYTSKTNYPSLIITLFVAFAFIDYYKVKKDPEILNVILSIKNLIISKLESKKIDNLLWYSYNFDKKNEIFNATAKVGKFFAKLYELTNDKSLLTKIESITNYLIRNQRKDGSWAYAPSIKYSDSFHTAFILESIYIMNSITKKNNFDSFFLKGLENYKTSFFTKDFQPLYIHPVHKNVGVRKLFEVTQTDIRDCAMAVELFKIIGDISSAKKVLKWTNKNMYNTKKNYFYFYKEKFWKNKIKYIRPQGWMLYAISNM